MLSEIRRLARSGLILLTDHARRRMYARGVLLADVRCALLNATALKKSAAEQASDWTVSGPDMDGDELTLGVVVSGGVVVITVF